MIVIEVPDIPERPKVQIDPEFQWITDGKRAEINQQLAERFGYHPGRPAVPDGEVWVDTDNEVAYLNPRMYEAYRQASGAVDINCRSTKTGKLKRTDMSCNSITNYLNTFLPMEMRGATVPEPGPSASSATKTDTTLRTDFLSLPVRRSTGKASCVNYSGS